MSRVIYLDAHSPAHLWMTGFRTSHLAPARGPSPRGLRWWRYLAPGTTTRPGQGWAEGSGRRKSGDRVRRRHCRPGWSEWGPTPQDIMPCRQEAQKGWAWLFRGVEGVCGVLGPWGCGNVLAGMGQGGCLGGRCVGRAQLTECDSLKLGEVLRQRYLPPPYLCSEKFSASRG